MRRLLVVGLREPRRAGRSGARSKLGDTKPQPDFFVSYTAADREWAEWIAWELEEAGYRTVLQAWDFAPGDNFVAEMQRASAQARSTIAVLSDAYLDSRYAEAEWTAAFRQATLLPVRVGGAPPDGILGPIVWVDLVGLDEPSARTRLRVEAKRFLEQTRGKPEEAPPFPRHRRERPVVEPGRFPASLPPHWNVPRPHKPSFTGRSDELAAILGVFERGERAALTGLGGMGKSQLSAEYAYRHADRYQIVWWVRADGEATLAADLAALAVDLGLARGDDRDLRAGAAEAVRTLEQSADWLLVLDDAPDPAAVGPYLPRTGSGHVLVTSRDPAWRSVATPVALDVLPLSEASAFLAERSGDESASQAAAELAEALGRLPLALEQAAGYVEARSSTLSTFLALFRAHESELLARGGAADYPVPLAAAWEVSFEALEQDAAAAASLLEVLAFLAPEDIPARLLVTGRNALSQPVADALDPLSFEDELAPALVRSSLVARRDDALAVHPLVQAVTRGRLTEELRSARAAEAAALLAAAFDFDRERPEGWPWCARLLPHALAAARHAESAGASHELLAGLLLQTARYLSIRGELPQARELLTRALESAEHAFGPGSPAVGSVLSDLGSVLTDLGEYDQARASHERALAIAEASFGANDANVATTLSNLGLALLGAGELPRARSAFERALRINGPLGPDHPDVARDVNNLGLVLRGMGDLQGARQAYQAALASAERSPAGAHPDLVTGYRNLGHVLVDLGDLDGARATFERALHLAETIFGADDRQVSLALRDLGAALRELGDLRAAAAAFERAASIDETALGPAHLDVGADLNGLGLARYAMGDLSGAREAFERALAITEATLGTDAAEVGTLARNLGSVFHDAGELERAKALYERALVIDERELGPGDPQVALDLNDLAAVLRELGALTAARGAVEQAIAIDERAGGRKSPQLATDFNNLALILEGLGEDAAARAAYRRALEVAERTLGKGHPYTETIRRNLGVERRSFWSLRRR
jgi:tetratricopeptide (TPR) repeat protein